ncbi:MAG: restriction endonuclease [Planctomycetes bacterium]|nr:restriction endonuclease [Planctomycetota bacterium]
MPIPDYQSMMLPLLRWFGDGQEKKLRDAVETMSVEFRLTDADRDQLMSSGQTVIYNRVAWACTYLRKAVLLETAGRGIYRVTSRGREVLASNPPRIDAAYLRRFEEFVAFSAAKGESSGGSVNADGEGSIPTSDAPPPPDSRTPLEAIDEAYARMREALESEVLDQVRGASPQFFERLVVGLLVSMGYGGSNVDAGEALGRSGDGGIDGIIKQDAFGLEVIYLQAKKWDGPVGRPEIQKFAGALQGQRARKGVFLTTSSFTKEAREYVRLIDSKIVLIDGETLARLMVDHDVGVVPGETFVLKKLDRDFFEGE